MYWCIIRGNGMFAAHCLFTRILPINSARESGKGNVFFQDCGEIKKGKTSTTKAPDQFQTL
jgi:hypothetical protein